MSDNRTSDCGSHPIVTIEDAIAAYKNRSPEAESYRDLIALLIDAGISHPFQNSSYFHALLLTEQMLTRTNRHIRILTGNACGRFYATLLNHLTETLQRIHANGGSAKMIVCADQCPRWLDKLSQEFSGTFQIGLGSEAATMPHFIVCDSQIVRCEEVHGDLANNSCAHDIKAQVIFDAPDKSMELERSFDALWEKAQKSRAADSPKTTAPSWLIQRMEALQELPPPTLEEVERSIRSAEVARRKSELSLVG